MKTLWVWDTSYEESAKCQTNSDHGDTNAPDTLQNTNLIGPDKENIVFESCTNVTLHSITVENISDGVTVESLDFTTDEKSFFQHHAYKSPLRKIAQGISMDMSLEENTEPQRKTILTEQAMDIPKLRRRSPRLQELDEQKTLKANMDVVETVPRHKTIEQKSKIPLYAASPARKKPRITVNETVQDKDASVMSIETITPTTEVIFKKPVALFGKTNLLPKEMEIDKENMSTLFVPDNVNKTTCNFEDIDFEGISEHITHSRRTIHDGAMELSHRESPTFVEKLDDLQFSLEGKNKLWICLTQLLIFLIPSTEPFDFDHFN